MDVVIYRSTTVKTSRSREFLVLHTNLREYNVQLFDGTHLKEMNLIKEQRQREQINKIAAKVGACGCKMFDLLSCFLALGFIQSS